ncbi:unnamed protein product [Agarophyton chilense]
MSPRRVNVFARADGTCLHDVVWQQPSQQPQPPEAHKITADNIWPIIHNFISLARDVDGGPLRRLVFRNPSQYAPTVANFDPIVKHAEHRRAPVVVHVHSDSRFVITVTECVQHYSLFHHSPYSSAFTLSEFCSTLLHWLGEQHAAFVGARMTGVAQVQHGDDGSVSTDALECVECDEHELSDNWQQSGGHSADEQTAAPQHSPDDVKTLRAMIEQSRIAEMIDNTMKLVQMER